MNKKKAFCLRAITLLLTHISFYAHHTIGPYDLDGIAALELVRSACSSPLEEQLDALIIPLQDARDSKRFFLTQEEERKISQLGHAIEAIEPHSTSIDWRPYLQNTLVDKDGNTLRHKLAEQCDQYNTEELLILIKLINQKMKFQHAIPVSFENINGSKTNGQPVFVRGPISSHGAQLSPSFKNNKGQTDEDILRQKIKDNTYLGLFAFGCTPCQQLLENSLALQKKEQSSQSIIDYIRDGKK